MGACRAWARSGFTCPPPKMLKSVFLLQMLSKTAVDEVFMRHFQKMLSAFGGFPQALTGELYKTKYKTYLSQAALLLINSQYTVQHRTVLIITAEMMSVGTVGQIGRASCRERV